MTRLKALLAVGTLAAAGPFGVSMSDPVKPDDGWSPGGFGSKGRESKGALGFEFPFGLSVAQAKSKAARKYVMPVLDHTTTEKRCKVCKREQFRREFLGLHFTLRRWVVLYRPHG